MRANTGGKRRADSSTQNTEQHKMTAGWNANAGTETPTAGQVKKA